MIENIIIRTVRKKGEINSTKKMIFFSQIKHSCPFFENDKCPSLKHDWHKGPVYPFSHLESFFPLFMLKY